MRGNVRWMCLCALFTLVCTDLHLCPHRHEVITSTQSSGSSERGINHSICQNNIQLVWISCWEEGNAPCLFVYHSIVVSAMMGEAPTVHEGLIFRSTVTSLWTMELGIYSGWREHFNVVVFVSTSSTLKFQHDLYFLAANNSVCFL